MRIFIVELDGAGQPADPVLRWYGPLMDEVFCDWIAFEEQCDESEQVQPEKEFPSERHLRRTGWLCVGVRPTRAMPRGLRTELHGVPGASGTAPPGIIGTELECWDGDPINAVVDIADYDGNDGASPRTTWKFTTTTVAHTTDPNPLSYVDDDFLFDATCRYVASDGSPWGIVSGPDDYDGSFALSGDPVPSLAISRRSIDGPKIRSIVFKSMVEPPSSECGPGVFTAPMSLPFPVGSDPAYALELTDGVKHVFEQTLVTFPTPPTFLTGFFFALSQPSVDWIWGWFEQPPLVGWVCRGPGPVSSASSVQPVEGDELRYIFDRSVDPPFFSLEVNDVQRCGHLILGPDPTCGFNARMSRVPNDGHFGFSDVLWFIE